MLVDADLKGTINLENIQKAYPVQMDLDLKGILKADITTSFDMASVEKKAYERIRNSGHASLDQVNYYYNYDILTAFPYQQGRAFLQ